VRAPGLADSLVIATSGRSRIVSLALKDRSAIILAGDAPRAAIWLEKTAGKFTAGTWSKAGIDPRWLAEVNESRGAAKSFGVVWDRLRSDLDYTALAGPDDDPSETEVPGLGRKMPKTLGEGLTAPTPDYYDGYSATPHALESLMELSRRAVREEQLGRRGTIDMLAVGISTLDYAGHYFGPRSHEALDMFLRIDRAIGELYEMIEREVGAGSVLWVLTADHGVVLMPEELSELGVRGTRVDPRPIVRAVEQATAKLDGPKRGFAKVLDINPPRLYLGFPSPPADRLAYQRAAAAALRALPEIVDARPPSELREMAEPMRTLFLRASATGRDPDVLFLQRPNDLIDYVAGDAHRGYGSGHGTPYLYDATVPVIIAGPGVPHLEDRTPHPMTRLAPTIAVLLGIDPPAAAFDPPLPLVE
jgi:hypothetical protein